MYWSMRAIWAGIVGAHHWQISASNGAITHMQAVVHDGTEEVRIWSLARHGGQIEKDACRSRMRIIRRPQSVGPQPIVLRKRRPTVARRDRVAGVGRRRRMSGQDGLGDGRVILPASRVRHAHATDDDVETGPSKELRRDAIDLRGQTDITTPAHHHRINTLRRRLIPPLKQSSVPMRSCVDHGDRITLAEPPARRARRQPVRVRLVVQKVALSVSTATSWRRTGHWVPRRMPDFFEHSLHLGPRQQQLVTDEPNEWPR